MRSTSSLTQRPTLGAYYAVCHESIICSVTMLTLFTGSLNVSVADSCFITCPKTGLKVILEYQEEGWLGRSQNKVLGVIFKYDPKNDTVTKIKDVSEKDVLARIEGNWQDKVYYTLGSKPFAKVAVSILISSLHHNLTF